MTKQEIVKIILAQARVKHGEFVDSNGGYAWAPSNLALCKYWGKRDVGLNLPVTSSLSISLGKKGACTHIKQQDGWVHDRVVLNGKEVASKTFFAKRLSKFLDLFRPQANLCYLIETETTVPVAAGLASSACGYAALVQALDGLYGWQLGKKELSILARLGSGSACRSLWDGFVEWHVGSDPDGMDSHGEPLDYIWPDLRIGLIIVSSLPKAVSSTEAMQRTVETSPLYSSWPQLVAQDLNTIKNALVTNDFMLLGETAECNALAMHATAASARPPIIYHQPETIAAMHRVWDLRDAKIPVYFTQDAGANLQLLFLAAQENVVKQAFPEVEIIQPFFENRVDMCVDMGVSEINTDKNREHLILVDETDVEIGVGEKIAVHVQGKLHRAFSIFIMRESAGKTDVLLQQRSSEKYHSPNLWSNTCCGHPRVGEDIVVAAQRRLQEEMGFTVSLQEIGSFHYRAVFKDIGMIEDEIDHVLVGTVDVDSYANAFSVNTAEVQDYRWVSLDELLLDLEQNPHKYTAWLPKALQVLLHRLSH